jgi:hypothetical protein
MNTCHQHARVRAHTHAHMHTYTHAHAHTHAGTHTHAYPHKHTCTHTQTHTETHTHTHTHTHTREETCRHSICNSPGVGSPVSCPTRWAPQDPRTEPGGIKIPDARGFPGNSRKTSAPLAGFVRVLHTPENTIFVRVRQNIVEHDR